MSKLCRLVSLARAALAVLVLDGMHPQQVIASSFSDGLLAYWSFNDGSAADSSGNGFDGTIIGSLETIAGIEGSAFHFSGGSFISVEGDELGVTTSLERSISLWVRPESVQGPACCTGTGLISKYRHFVVPQANFYAALTMDGNRLVTILTGEGTDGIYAGAGELGVWQHFVFVLKDGENNSRIYWNGALIASEDLNYNPTVTSEPLRIGTIVGADDQSFRGDLDEIRMYDRVLTESEIRALAGIPEPSTMVLFGIGLTGIVFARRRRKDKR